MLIQCPECELNVSDKALACPHCGYPMSKNQTKSCSRIRHNKRKRLPNGFGQISEIKNRNLRKPFRAMVTVGKEENGHPICKLLKPEAYFETYNEAYSALLAYNKNPYSLDSDMTVKELYERWTKEYFKTLKSKSSVSGINAAWAYCTTVYGMKASDLRAYHIKGCIEDGTVTTKSKVKHTTANLKCRIKSLFNLMLDFALEYEIVERNYARTFELSDELVAEVKKTKNEHIPFTDEEMELLWMHLGNIEGIDVLLIQCYSGWRPQELGLLRLEDIDLENGFMTGGIKTAAGAGRIVPIHSRIEGLVRQRYLEAKKLNSTYLFNYMDPKTPDDTQMTYSRFNKCFNAIVKRLNLNPDHRPHDGRKHFVTKAKEAHLDEYAIKYIIGHSITDITEKVYTQRNTNWLKSEIEKIK